MPNFQNGKIYKVINDELPDLVYYGSTTYQYLSKRLSNHKIDIMRSNLSIKPLFSKGIPKIVLVENYPCKSRKELHEREKYYIENNECINKFIPCRTKKEWYEQNKEKVFARLKEKITCECGAIVQRGVLTKHKRTNKHWRLLNNK